MAIHKHQNLYFQYRSKGGFEASGELINLMRTFDWKEVEGDQPLNTALAGFAVWICAGKCPNLCIHQNKNWPSSTNPIHSPEEKKLFSFHMGKGDSVATTVQAFNQAFDGISVFPKLPDHITSYKFSQNLCMWAGLSYSNIIHKFSQYMSD
jgi:hypothetical protein